MIVMTFLVRECYGSPKKHENLLKFLKICAEECFDKVLNEEFKKQLMCKMKNVVTRLKNPSPLNPLAYAKKNNKMLKSEWIKSLQTPCEPPTIASLFAYAYVT